jgi:cytochrome c oxidase cbb3-type subunit I
MVGQFTLSERHRAFAILLALAAAGLVMAAVGSGDPLGVHGALIMVVAIVGIFAVISGYFDPEPPTSAAMPPTSCSCAKA